ncbi:CHAT domain protein [Ceratobasidium sp. AG-Ba]|nr:CHAT domain protein [Ceratobasidium sp. AG-Ba]
MAASNTTPSINFFSEAGVQTSDEPGLVHVDENENNPNIQSESPILGYVPHTTLEQAGLQPCDTRIQSYDQVDFERREQELVGTGIERLISYQNYGQLEDLNFAIECLKQADSLNQNENQSNPSILTNIGNGYLLRFSQLGELEDIETAIIYHRQALLSAPHDYDLVGLLNNLSGSHLSRFERSWDVKDVEAAFECQSRVLALLAEDDPTRPSVLNNIGRVLESRYQHLGHVDDLNNSIQYLTEAVALTPDDDPHRAGRLNNLGHLQLVRFELLDEADDLSMAIGHQTLSVSLTPTDHVEKPRRLGDLADAYHARFIRSRDIDDILSAIERYHLAIPLIPDAHPIRPFTLNSLAKSLLARYQLLGNPDDLDSAIALQTQAVTMISDDNISKAGILDDLAISYQHRFRRFERLVDLDHAVLLHVQSIGLTPDTHPDKPTRLNNSAATLHDRFKWIGERSDLDEAVSQYKKALALMPQDQSLLLAVLMNLGGLSVTQLELTAEVTQVESGLLYLNQALQMMPSGHPYEHTLLNNLGLLYLKLSERSGKLEDLVVAIDYQHRALSLLEDGRPERVAWLNNLGNSYQARYHYSKELADIDKSIELYNQAVQICPAGHPLLATVLRGLGRSYYDKFLNLGHPSFFESSSRVFKNAVKMATAPPSERLATALTWARSSLAVDPASSKDAYKHAMGLVSQVAWVGSPVDSRYSRIMKELSGVTLEAPTAAIDYEDYSSALEWLEEGKAIVWKQALQLRTPLEQIIDLNEDLGKELESVSRDLQVSSTRDILTHIDNLLHPPTLEHIAQRQRHLTERWEELIVEARLLPGMSNFLLPVRASELIAAAHSSSVVCIVVHKDNSNALVVKQASNSITHVPLSNFSSGEARSAHLTLARSLSAQGHRSRGISNKPQDSHGTLEKIFLMLWSSVVEPVLNHLGFMHNLSKNPLPRITWCTTGALNFLPLHAAGDYSIPGCALFDYAISSYTPSLTALLNGSPDSSDFSGVLAIGQTSTPGMPQLPGTVIELDQISRRVHQTRFKRLEGSDATTLAVLGALGKYDWVHFACHASQNMIKPTLSAFHLHDGPLELDTIARNPLRNASMAFLSACQTAMGDENVPDEAVHLAAGMLMTGFRTVIATMWSIEDADAPIVAEKFYTSMLQDGIPTGRSAAVALHDAVAHLRSQVGVQEFRRWVPFIHLGI